MNKKIISLLLVVFLIATTMTACTSDEGTSPKEPVNDTKGETTIFIDSTGREVELPANITRIVPSGQLAQIALFALAPDMFVGLSNQWSSDAEQYLDTKYYNLPVLGQIYGQDDLNLEEIAKVDPEVIIDIGESKTGIGEDMDGITEQIGIPTVHIEATMENMGEAYRMLGELLGRVEDAEVLAEYSEEVYNNTLDIIEQVGEEGKVDLIYSTDEDGLKVLAKGSFHAEIIDMVSNNVAVVDEISSRGLGNPIDMEQLMLWNPDTIIFAPGGVYEEVANSELWQELTAIQEENYYEVPSGPYNWMGMPPSVNRYMGMIWITQLLYPDQAQYDLYEETVKYYELFYHSQLTEEQYQDLISKSI